MLIRSKILNGLFAFYLSLTAPVMAHELGDARDVNDGPSEQAALVPIAGVGWRGLTGDHAVPVPRLPGVLESGVARSDQRGGSMDYMELGLLGRWNEHAEGQFKLTRHGEGDGAMEVESAWVRGRFPVSAGVLSLKVGRQQAPIGVENREHDHARLFGIAPLVYRADINDSWRDDGVEILWQTQTKWYAGVGGFRGKAFPGANTKGMGAMTARVGYAMQPWTMELGAAWLDAPGRTLETSAASANHSHGGAQCQAARSDRVCLDGEVQLMTLSVQWQPEPNGMNLSGEFWVKRDAGQLYSLDGRADDIGLVKGGWVQAGWRFDKERQVALRAERIALDHDLKGSGVIALAKQAGILDSDDALWRVGVVFDWLPAKGHRLSLEAHHEEITGHQGAIVLLRYQMDLRALEGLWH